jgi:hypothetical protein
VASSLRPGRLNDAAHARWRPAAAVVRRRLAGIALQRKDRRRRTGSARRVEDQAEVLPLVVLAEVMYARQDYAALDAVAQARAAYGREVGSGSASRQAWWKARCADQGGGRRRAGVQRGDPSLSRQRVGVLNLALLYALTGRAVEATGIPA